ncbi:hypothetical protein [Serratia quinivorans]|uniref:hypothetical protein n=1 Tax=Serratia quinivorans TaxID=137545 RepID=UPI0039823911
MSIFISSANNGTNEMNNQSLTPITLGKTQQSFHIHEKLKAEKSHWSYAFPVSPVHGEAKAQLNTCLLDKPEFAVYERVGSNFVLVDFADNYNSLNDEAKKIIDKNPKAKESILAWENHYSTLSE